MERWLMLSLSESTMGTTCSHPFFVCLFFSSCPSPDDNSSCPSPDDFSKESAKRENAKREKRMLRKEKGSDGATKDELDFQHSCNPNVILDFSTFKILSFFSEHTIFHGA